MGPLVLVGKGLVLGGLSFKNRGRSGSTVGLCNPEAKILKIKELPPEEAVGDSAIGEIFLRLFVSAC